MLRVESMHKGAESQGDFLSLLTDARLGPIMVAYVLSFFFWFGLHWAWHLSNRQLAKS